MTSEKITKRNLIMYPLGTVGRDMIYQLFTNFLLTYILFTRQLTAGQLLAITAIMVAARVFDALNDPIMGNIIENTRTKYGKYKPWLVIGIITTSFVVYFAFNTRLQGWSFVWFIGLIYFLYSITYTMHDISYWSMIASLGSDADDRNKFTSRATLFAGIGSTLASILIPIFTLGAYTIGGSSSIAYGRAALIVCILAPLFLCFTIFGVQENRDENNKELSKISFRKIFKTISGNDQLLWISLIFLIQQVGNGIALGGIASTYIYFDFGYEGGLFSLFSTLGVLPTAVLMLVFPTICRKNTRKSIMKFMAGVAGLGYAMMLSAGLLISSGNIKFIILTIGNMLSNLAQYCFYLIMMISIINTVEYNEYKYAIRDEAIIASLRPFLTKLGSAIVVLITSLSYLIFEVTDFTNRISELERSTSMGVISEAEKLNSIRDILSNVNSGQSSGLLICMTVLPCLLLLLSYYLYKKHYSLDENEYNRICAVLEERKKNDA